jgi:hypothetical protein
MARNFSLFPPNPLLSASFMSSDAGSDPGERMNTIGENGVLCSKMLWKKKSRINWKKSDKLSKNNHYRRASYLKRHESLPPIGADVGGPKG